MALSLRWRMHWAARQVESCPSTLPAKSAKLVFQSSMGEPTLELPIGRAIPESAAHADGHVARIKSKSSHQM